MKTAATLTLAALLLLGCTTPRAASPSAHPDSAQLGAPLSATTAEGSRGAPSSRSVANVAASEGPSPTTPMTGTRYTGTATEPDPPDSHLASRQGDISHMGPGYPKSYLALPCKHGNVRCHLTVRLCGPADCVTMRQTDYGPSQRIHPDRIADVSIAVFERICGVPARFGLCPGSWTAVTHDAIPTLPATSTKEED